MALKNLNVKFTSDTTGFSKGLKAVNTGLKQATSGISSLMKTAAGLAGVTLGIKGLADSFKAFTALESNVKRVGSLFGDAAKNIQGFAQGSAKALGMSESAAYQYAATYGNLFKNITSGAVENTAVTIKMLQASAVVASKTGRTMEDVMDRIRSGLLGSTEAIEDLGINVNISMLEMTDAFKKIANGRSWAQLNFYEQQQIRTLGILEQAHKNFGDEVQQGTAFSLSVLSSAFKDLMATVGSFVNSALAPIIKALTTIVQLANTALKGLSALLGLNATISQTSSGMETGSAAASDMADGIDDSTKAAKKLNQQLAGFDKLNDLSKIEAGTSPASASDSGGAGGMGIEIDFEEVEPPDTTWADKLTAWAKEFGTLLAPLKTSLSGLWSTLKEIGGFAWQGLKNFYDSFLKPVGTWVLGTGLPRLVDALKNGLEAVNWEKINGAFDRLWKALAPFAVHVGEGLLWLLNNILIPLGAWALGTLLPAVLEGMAAAVGMLDAAALAIAPGLAAFLEALKPIAEWIGEKVVDAIRFASEIMDDWAKWFKDNRETFKRLGKALGDVAEAIWDMLEPILDDAWDAFKSTVKWLNDNLQWLADLLIEQVIANLNSLKDTISELSGSIIFTKNAWSEAKKAASDALESIKEKLAPLGRWISEHVTSPIGKAFASTLESVKTGWGRITEWFSEKVINPIMDAFKGGINFLIGLAEGFANGFIKGINAIIKALNKIGFTLPEWLGGGSFGINIPTVSEISLPRLASGGMAYGEVQAIVGDNHNARQDPEVISPLSKLQEMITAAMLQRDIAGGGSGQKLELRITMEDGTPFIEALIDPMNRTAKNLGYGAVFKVEMA